MTLDTMREGRRTPRVALINYTTVRGKNPEKLICIFEGLEDLPYYETIFNRTINIDFASVIAKGKDQVLGLRDILLRNDDPDKNVRFFVDHDFDGLKGHPPGEDIYVTDGYSIENHLVTKDILRSLLSSEYKCSAEAEYDAIERVSILFESFLDRFFEIMRPVNRAIYYARTHGVELKNIEDRVTEYVLVTLNGLSPTDNDYFSLIGWPETEPKKFFEVEESFSKIDPHLQWRGKFIFDLFTKFLHALKIDRTKDSPEHFPKKLGIKFDPNGEIIRTLASLSEIPITLSKFLNSCNIKN